MIVLHGVNGTGKTTQCKKLVERIEGMGESARFIKYPVYDNAPTGLLLNEYLRGANPKNLTPQEMSLLQVINRRDQHEELKEILERGIHVIAESYTGTGVVWAIAFGMNRDLLRALNSGERVVTPDAEILLDGERFVTGKETGHLHEENDTLIERVKAIYSDVAREERWGTVSPRGTIVEVHERIWLVVKPFFAPAGAA